jgi:hypothetical protein
MAITNKVVIPKDYTATLEFGGLTTKFTATNTVTIDKTADDYSITNTNWPIYNMIGEFAYLFPATTISVANNSSTMIRTLRCQINVNNTLNRYRYIRFILEPSVTYRNTGTVLIPKLNFSFTLVYNGTRYSIAKVLSITGIPASGSFTTSKYSFIFDTVGKTLTDITSTWGTDTWGI